MRKLGFSTIACPDLPWREILDVGASCGMRAIEIRLDREDRPFGLQKEEIPTLKRALADHGMTVSDVGTGIALTREHPGLAERLAPVFEVASELGAAGVRVFLGHSALRVPEGKTEDEGGIVKTLGEIAKVAERYPAKLWLETHGTYSRAEDVCRVLDAAGAGDVGVIWDIFHSYEAGESVDRSDEVLGNRTVHLHIKDGVKVAEGAPMSYTKVGEGEVPLPHAIELLDSRGFDGVLSLEWENMWRPELRSVYPDLAAILHAYQAWAKTLPARP